MSPSAESRSRVSELVRSAEKQLLSGRHDAALEQLRRAQKLDPQNQYIQAIIQRAELGSHDSARPQSPDPLSAPGHRSSRYLSVTVGAELPGAGSPAAQETFSAQETARRVRELTETAQVLLNRGLSESAFDTLMRAYLLDPVHPDVISCEQKVLPAWEDLRRLRQTAAAPSVTPSTPAGRLQSLRREEVASAGARERQLWQALSGPPPHSGKSGLPAPGAGTPPHRSRKKKS